MTKEKNSKSRTKKFNLLGFVFGVVGLIFATSILFASIWKASAQNTIKSEQYQLTVNYQDEDQQDENQEGESSYFLAYPGMLPDHPLYPFKVLRDRVWLFATLSKRGKVEKELLFADKRIFAALQLMEKNKPNKAVETALKAEYYLLSASESSLQLEGTSGQELRQKIKEAILKHREVLDSLQVDIETEAGEISRSLEINSQAKAILE